MREACLLACLLPNTAPQSIASLDPTPSRGSTATQSPLSSSRRLLGASFTSLSDKWQPRCTAAAGASSDEEGGGCTSEEGGGGYASDVEAPMLGGPRSPRAPRSPPYSPLRRPSTGSGGASGVGGGRGEGSGAAGSSGAASRAASFEQQLVKYGSREFESPFWPAAQAPPQVSCCQC